MEVDRTTTRVRRRIAVWLVALTCIAVAAVGAYVYAVVHQPYQAFTGQTFVLIQPGTSTREIARRLASQGVLRYGWAFEAIRAVRPEQILHAGEYRFDEPASPWSVFDRLVRGDVFYHSFTVPEGSNLFQTARIIARLDWISENDVLAAANKSDLIADLDPAATNLEGYLFPSTYRVTRGTSAEEICRMMTQEFRRVWSSVSPAEGTDVRAALTLASLVEKETGVKGERPLVAGVFHNRIERGIKLECDPTVIYAAILENRHDGVIHRSDLDSLNPYNTYRHSGLPPGPIASPGRASIEASLSPAETDYLFFVARPDGSGAHEFSETLADHSRAVRNYRRGIEEARRKAPVTGIPERDGSGESH